MSLVELMVALAIGSILIAGAVYVYSQSRNTQRVSETVARLQENGRYVFSVLEPDIQLAGYYGYSNAGGGIQFISDGDLGAAIPAARLRPANTAATGVNHTCGNNYAVNVITTIEGSNDNPTFPLACTDDADAAGGILEGTDFLTIRRSSGPPAVGNGAAAAGRAQLLVNRLNPNNTYMFADGGAPASPALKDDLVQIRDLVVRSYYVSNNSVDPDIAGLPALHVMTPYGEDDEVMRGVEEFQVQFGYDTGSYDGNDIIDAGFDEDGNGIPDASNGIATRYVDPGAVPFGYQVVSVRVWLLLRAEQVEQGFTDDREYVMGSKTIPARNDGFRRVLMSKTIQLRNARTL